MPDQATLASVLSDAGYLTWLETSNIRFSEEYNSDYGFTFSERPNNRSATGIFNASMDGFLPHWENGDWSNFYLHMHVRSPT